MHYRSCLVIGLTTILAGCQVPMEYHRIGPGPELEYAQAQCDILSMGVEQQIIAVGSPNYVLGAQLGNDINNATRKRQFVQNCMVMQGWKGVPVSRERAEQQASQNAMEAAERRTAAVRAIQGPPPPAPPAPPPAPN